MKLWNKLGYLGLCAGVAIFALSATQSWASGGTDDVDVTIDVTEPSVTATATDATFGEWAIINKSTGPAAQIVIGTDGTIDASGAGAYPDSRFVVIDDSAAAPVLIALTGGAFNETLTFQIGHASTTPGEIDTHEITMVMDGGTPGVEGELLLDTWVCEVEPSNAFGTTTPEVFTETGTPGEGNGTVVLGTAAVAPDITNGGANIACGMTIRTDGTGNPYSTGTYRGLARVNVDYI